jgi:hypothetical protein
MEITPQNANSIARTLGKSLLEAGYKMLASSYNINSQQVYFNDFSALLQQKLPNVEQGLMDNNYYLIPFSVWKDIIASDWLSQTKQYVTDKYDCDNFAYTFAAHVSELFDISVATCYGEVFNKDTKVSLGLHYWNVIPTKEIDGSLHIYFYEPQNNMYCEITGKTDITLNMIYKPIKVIVF